jgi:rubrerythrin
MSQLPAGAPENPGEAFARIAAVASPSLDDLKLMVYLEASGQSAYLDLARTAPEGEIRALLETNGREEMAHAHRVAKVIHLLSGETFEVPKAEDNPYAKPSDRKVDRPLLQFLVGAEDGGCALYETWASHTDNAEAAALLRLNAREETRHGERVGRMLELMPA